MSCGWIELRTTTQGRWAVALPETYPVGSRSQRRTRPSARTQQYVLRRTFFTTAEGNFYRALVRAVGDKCLVFAKVRLLDICNAFPADERWPKYRIQAKHVDFLLCHPASLRPVLAIEVDDRSHELPDRAARDRFVNALFEEIGLPLLRIPSARWFDPADVLRRVENAIVSS